MSPSQYNRTLFVYAKGAIIQCLSSDELTPIQSELERAGWTHISTIDPARWIEAMANARGDRRRYDMVLELILGPEHPAIAQKRPVTPVLDSEQPAQGKTAETAPLAS